MTSKEHNKRLIEMLDITEENIKRVYTCIKEEQLGSAILLTLELANDLKRAILDLDKDIPMLF
jgi:hypothetical protein